LRPRRRQLAEAQPAFLVVVVVVPEPRRQHLLRRALRLPQHLERVVPRDGGCGADEQAVVVSGASIAAFPAGAAVLAAAVVHVARVWAVRASFALVVVARKRGERASCWRSSSSCSVERHCCQMRRVEVKGLAAVYRI
jgi:hypothetical protein